jgi:hypothetical protein
VSTLYVAWQSPKERSWFTVGQLSYALKRYRFRYTKGALLAYSHGFVEFSAFPDLYVTYESDRLFPFFGNRLLSRSRREYADFVRWVSHHESSNDPMALLAGSGGTRMTDSLELFPKPELDQNGHYHVHFFLHGLSHMPASAAVRAEQLEEGERLLIMKDVQNTVDPLALMLRTQGSYEQDIYFVGYFPRYFAREFSPVLEDSKYAPVQVLRVNRPPAPIQFRVMCCFQVKPPADAKLFGGDEFIPLMHPSAQVLGTARRLREIS